MGITGSAVEPRARPPIPSASEPPIDEVRRHAYRWPRAGARQARLLARRMGDPRLGQPARPAPRRDLWPVRRGDDVRPPGSAGHRAVGRARRGRRRRARALSAPSNECRLRPMVGGTEALGRHRQPDAEPRAHCARVRASGPCLARSDRPVDRVLPTCRPGEPPSGARAARNRRAARRRERRQGAERRSHALVRRFRDRPALARRLREARIDSRFSRPTLSVRS